MSHESSDAETGVPGQFERNRYFHGKLMTARDMEAEQDYLRRRMATLSRGVLGVGVVAGLEVTGVEETDEDVRVTVTPGVALDAAGRTVVVPEGTGSVTVRSPGTDNPLPPGDVTDEPLALVLRYDHCSTERVPAAGVEHTTGDNSEFGRVVETFVIEAEPLGTVDGGDPVSPGPKPVPEVALPGPEATPDEAGRRAAAEGFVGGDPAPALVLATLARETEDEVLTVGEVDRPLVYPNDLVYATAVTHATDRENPHDVEVDQVEGAVASVGGVDPDDTGNVGVSSDTDGLVFSSEADSLVLTSDALRSLRVEGVGVATGNEIGRIILFPEDDSMAFTVDGNRIGLRADALRSVSTTDGGVVDGDPQGGLTFQSTDGSLGIAAEAGTDSVDFSANALRSVAVDGDETVVAGGENRQVTVGSPDGSVTITTNDAGDRLDFAAVGGDGGGGDVDLEGVLRQLGGLADHGGAIEFTSSNDSVVVEQFEEEDSVLDVRVTEDFEQRLSQRILDGLQDEDDGPVFPIEDIRDSIREDLRVELRESIRTDVEEDLGGRFDELNRTNETLLTQLNRLSETADPTDQPVTSLEGVSLSTANDLRERGIVSLGDLNDASDEEILEIPNVGEATLNDFRTRLNERLG